jgi:hypothetical protein
MGKYTAGPWQVVKLDDDVYIQKGNGTKENSGQALLARIQRSGEQQKANASLIAAAPELLEALKQCENIIGMARLQGKLSDNALDPVNDALLLARSAISKAEGRQ